MEFSAAVELVKAYGADLGKSGLLESLEVMKEHEPFLKGEYLEAYKVAMRGFSKLFA